MAIVDVARPVSGSGASIIPRGSAGGAACRRTAVSRDGRLRSGRLGQGAVARSAVGCDDNSVVAELRAPARVECIGDLTWTQRPRERADEGNQTLPTELHGFCREGTLAFAGRGHRRLARLDHERARTCPLHPSRIVRLGCVPRRAFEHLSSSRGRRYLPDCSSQAAMKASSITSALPFFRSATIIMCLANRSGTENVSENAWSRKSRKSKDARMKGPVRPE
jgi:hypothetical protein